MHKIHKQKKLFIGNMKITEICYRHFFKKSKKAYQLLQSLFQSQYEQY